MKLVFPNGDYAGVIFDCDGTLVDSMPVHFRAWQRVLEIVNHPQPFTEEAFYDLGGVPTDRLVEILNEQAGSAHDPETLSRLKEETLPGPVTGGDADRTGGPLRAIPGGQATHIGRFGRRSLRG